MLTRRPEWTADKVKDVRARFALLAFNPPRMTSAVQIVPRGLDFTREVLRGYLLEEVNWVVGVLKRELGLGDETLQTP